MPDKANRRYRAALASAGAVWLASIGLAVVMLMYGGAGLVAVVLIAGSAPMVRVLASG